MGLEGYTGFGPFNPKPKVRTEKEEVSEDGRRESILLECTVEDDLVLARKNHMIGRCHVAQDNPLEDHERDSKSYGLAIGAW